MIFRPAGVGGEWVLEPERFEDERGFFARTWDTGEFEQRGLSGRLVQCSISYNRLRGTLRGLPVFTAGGFSERPDRGGRSRPLRGEGGGTRPRGGLRQKR